MATERFWHIHYGPEYIDDEAYGVERILNKVLAKFVQKIGGDSAIICDARVGNVHGCECECYEGFECFHVTALLYTGAGGDMTEIQLRERLVAECCVGDGGRTSLIKHCCVLFIESQVWPSSGVL